MQVWRPEGALEDSCGEVRIDEDVVRHEGRPLLQGVEEHPVRPLQPLPPACRRVPTAPHRFRMHQIHCRTMD